jgi:hypothetical protein
MASRVRVGTRASCAGRPPLPSPRREDLAETFGIFAQPCGSQRPVPGQLTEPYGDTGDAAGSAPASAAFRLLARRKLSARPELPRSAWLAAASIVRGRPGSGSRTARQAAGGGAGRQDPGARCAASAITPAPFGGQAGRRGLARPASSQGSLTGELLAGTGKANPISCGRGSCVIAGQVPAAAAALVYQAGRCLTKRTRSWPGPS